MDKELIKLIKDGEVKPKNLWIKVWDEDTGQDGLVSMSEIIDDVAEIIISMLHNKLNTQQRKKGEKLVEAKAIQTTETPNKDSVDNTSPAPVENNNQRTKRGKTKRYNINYKKIKESQKVLDKIFKKKMAVVNKKIKEKKKEPVA